LTAKALIICLDSASPLLLKRWMAEGALPNLRALQAIGTSGRITTPLAMGDDCVWASFYTGLPVDHHGRYFWAQLDADAGKVTHAADRLPEASPLWIQLSRAGMRIAALDVPKIAVARELNGIQLCDWLVHGRDYPNPRSYPADLAAFVTAEFGVAPASICSETIPPLSDALIAEVSRNLLQSVHMKRRCAQHFLKADDWDLFVVAFKEAHCATHSLWHLVDHSDSSHIPGMDQRLGEPLKAIYCALDNALGELIAEAGPDCSILVFSSLGMGRNHTGNHLLNQIVSRINTRIGPLSARCYGSLIALLHKLDLGNHADRYSTRTICRALPHNEASGAIRLNVAGRDPGGPVQFGADYDNLCETLDGALRALEAPQTGRRIVAQVIKTRNAFSGPKVDNLPDLFVVWDRAAPISSAYSPLLGRLEAGPLPNLRRGNHVSGGSFVMSGPASDAWASDGEIRIDQILGQFLNASGLSCPKPPSGTFL
jgi:predicted AlkP superfamily phosphohydrolase/phosphomutase